MPAGLTFARFTPGIALMPYIREYLIVETQDAIVNTLIPDTFMAMAIRIKGSTGFYAGNSFTTIPSGLISGLTDAARKVSYSAGSANLIIAFRDGGITAFSKVPAHDLFSQSISADDIFPRADLEEVTDKIREANTHEARIQVLETFLVNRLKRTTADPLIDTAVDIIRQHKGIIRIKDLATTLHISQDPFEKKFRARIGSSPKKFASITRIRNLINNYHSYSSLTDASYEAGFYDQSHFIREFRHFTGKTPRDFFSAPQGW